MSKIKETVSTLKSTAAKVNKEVLETSDTVVEETIAAGEEWNKVFEKALKTGKHILGQQQELGLMALEGLKKQYVTGNVRLRKLLGFQTPEVVETVKATTTTVEKKTKKVLSSTKKVVKEVKANAPKAKKVLASTAKKAVKTAKPTAAKAKKVLATTAKKAAPKAKKTKKILSSTKKITPAKATLAKKATKIDLKVINGIGPKMEKVLNAAGFITYADIATATEANLKAVLLAENKRYAMYEPKEWIAQAKKLVK